MFFALIVILTALVISGIAAYYSIIGLTAIFAAAFWPVVVMGGVLELGKIVSTIWLHKHWDQAPWRYKAYLVPAVIVLMFVTSMGIFGFLSKSHMDQGVPTGDIAAKVAILDERIKTQKENIDTARKVLTQMDSQVDQRLTRSTDEKAVERAVTIRKQQANERKTLQKEITAAQTEVAKLNEERAPIASQMRKADSDVGPIKYIAALVYGDNPDVNLLERAVRWVIIIIVFVFDPLALTLILAGSMSFEWALEARRKKMTAKIVVGDTVDPPPPATPIATSTTEEPAVIQHDFPTIEVPANQTKAFVDFVTKTPFAHPVARGEDSLIVDPPVELAAPIIEEPTPVPEIVVETSIANPDPAVPAAPARVLEARPAFHSIPPAPPETLAPYMPVADNLPVPSNVRADFGISFPKDPNKGDLYLRVDISPNKLCKWDGNKWIEIDKSHTDSLAYNDMYIAYLIEKVDMGEYEVDDLSPLEQEQIKKYLETKVT